MLYHESLDTQNTQIFQKSVDFGHSPKLETVGHMAKTKAVSFRLPSKYIVFLDHLAAEDKSDRTKILVQMLDVYLVGYLKRKGSAKSR